MRGFFAGVVFLAGLAGACGAAEKDDLLVFGPYVQSVTPDSAVVMWRTSRPVKGTVVAKPRGRGKAVRAAETEPAVTHELRLENLAPAAAYTYQASPPGVSGTFSTAPEGGDSVTFVVYGDTRSRSDKHKKVADAIAGEEAAFVIHTGDIVADGRKDEQWPAQFFLPAASFLRRFALFTVIGNHEQDSPLYYEYFSLPGNETWYSFDWAHAHFAFIEPRFHEIAPGSEQYAWLESDLASSKARWKFVVVHYPFLSSGPHGGSKELRDALHPLFAEQGVDMVFAGHDHIYERTPPVVSGKGSPVVYIVSGGGGAPLYSGARSSWSARFAAELHYIVISIHGDELSLRALRPDGTVIDEWSCRKGSEEFRRAAYPLGRIELEDLVRRLSLEVDAGDAGPLPFQLKQCGLRFSNPSDEPAVMEAAFSVSGSCYIVEPGRASVTVPAKAGEEAGRAVVGLTLGFPVDFPCPTPFVRFRVKAGDVEVESSKKRLPVKFHRLTRVMRCGEAPRIDGALTDAQWRRARPAALAVRDDGEFGRTRCEARALWDGEGVYFAFRNEEPSLRRLRMRASEHDSSQVWMDDGVEVFVDADLDRGTYRQFIVSVSGARYEGEGKDSSWDADWTARVNVDREAREWTAEMFMPWSSLGFERAPAPGTKLGLNYARHRNPVAEDYQWNCTFGSNHRPGWFGTAELE